MSRLDVERVLKTGAVRRNGPGVAGPKYAVTGEDLDGNRHKVVVARDDDGELAILTVHEMPSKKQR